MRVYMCLAVSASKRNVRNDEGCVPPFFCGERRSRHAAPNYNTTRAQY